MEGEEGGNALDPEAVTEANSLGSAEAPVIPATKPSSAKLPRNDGDGDAHVTSVILWRLELAQELDDLADVSSRDVERLGVRGEAADVNELSPVRPLLRTVVANGPDCAQNQDVS